MTRDKRRAPRARQKGFSIIEVLIGFTILLLILIGLLPIFTRGIIQNVSGRESTAVANHGRTQLENHLQMAFNRIELTVNAGNVRSTVDFWSLGDQQELGDEGWVDDPAGEIAPWQRTTEVRQFGINGVQDVDLDGVLDQITGLVDVDHDGYFDNPLPSGTSPNAIGLKEVRVLIESQRGSYGSGEPTELTVRGLKAF